MLEVMRDILQSRYLRSNVVHKQLARTSLNGLSQRIFMFIRVSWKTKTVLFDNSTCYVLAAIRW